MENEEAFCCIIKCLFLLSLPKHSYKIRFTRFNQMLYIKYNLFINIIIRIQHVFVHIKIMQKHSNICLCQKISSFLASLRWITKISPFLTNVKQKKKRMDRFVIKFRGGYENWICSFSHYKLKIDFNKYLFNFGFIKWDPIRIRTYPTPSQWLHDTLLLASTIAQHCCKSEVTLLNHIYSTFLYNEERLPIHHVFRSSRYY